MYGQTTGDKIECKMKRRGTVGITFLTDNAIIHLYLRKGGFSSASHDLPALNLQEWSSPIQSRSRRSLIYFLAFAITPY
jgi:hypothetical protein